MHLKHFEPRNEPVRFIVIHSCYSEKSPNPFCVKQIIQMLDELRLSYHFLISRSGHIFELVPDNYVAWHAGESFFPEFKIEKLNKCSIGISLIATESSGYTPVQMKNLIELLNFLFKKHSIEAITSHQHIAPSRKSDPWAFNWDFLRSKLKKTRVKVIY